MALNCILKLHLTNTHTHSIPSTSSGLTATPDRSILTSRKFNSMGSSYLLKHHLTNIINPPSIPSTFSDHTAPPYRSTLKKIQHHGLKLPLNTQPPQQNLLALTSTSSQMTFSLSLNQYTPRRINNMASSCLFTFPPSSSSPASSSDIPPVKI